MPVDGNEEVSLRTWRSGWKRIGAALITACAFGLGVYFLLEAGRPDNGLISFTFLLVLPAAICAFVAYAADPWSEQPLRTYLLVPVWILLAVIVISVAFLREGTICIIMLAPLWLLSGIAGTATTYTLRRRIRNGRTYCLTLLVAPVAMMQIEPLIDYPDDAASVSRSIIIEAPAATIWPLLKGIPDVRKGEGTWNFSQDVVGIPRPLGAALEGEGVGAERHANWGQKVSFDEVITEWSVNHRIGWRFAFNDIEGWRFTDRHLMPDSSYFRITKGGYTLTPLADDRTLVTIETHYWMKTPVNSYSVLWGQVFLGDLENNLLMLVKGRAENSHRPSGPVT